MLYIWVEPLGLSKANTQKHITIIQNEISPDKEKVAIIELDRID